MTDREKIIDLWSRMSDLEARVDGLEGADDDAPLTPAEAMARCPEVAALIFAAEACHHTSPPHPSHDLLTSALAAFTPLDPPPE